MTDLILVSGIRTSGRHGVAPFERERPTELLVDVEIALDVSRAAASDDLADTIDYTEVISEVRRVTEESSFALLERLATEIADRLLSLGATGVRVRVAKPAVAAALEADRVAVEVERSSA